MGWNLRPTGSVPHSGDPTSERAGLGSSTGFDGVGPQRGRFQNVTRPTSAVANNTAVPRAPYATIRATECGLPRRTVPRYRPVANAPTTVRVSRAAAAVILWGRPSRPCSSRRLAPSNVGEAPLREWTNMGARERRLARAISGRAYVAITSKLKKAPRFVGPRPVRNRPRRIQLDRDQRTFCRTNSEKDSLGHVTTWTSYALMVVSPSRRR